MPIRRVLVPIEDDYFIDAFVDFLAEHHWDSDAEFLILHVVKELDARIAPRLYAEYLDFARQFGGNLVSRVAERLRKALSTAGVEGKLVEGDPKQCIIEEAAACNAELIVMGAHGGGEANRYPLGSVTAAVSAAAPCSVLIVRLPSARYDVDGAIEELVKES